MLAALLLHAVCLHKPLTFHPQLLSTVFDAKRLIGRKFTDHIVQEDMKLWPFTVKAGAGDKPLIEGERLDYC